MNSEEIHSYREAKNAAPRHQHPTHYTAGPLGGIARKARHCLH